MTDEIDLAQERDILFTEDAIRKAQRKAELVPGSPGDCDLCGEWSARLVDGVCAPCRDHFKLP